MVCAPVHSLPALLVFQTPRAENGNQNSEKATACSIWKRQMWEEHHPTWRNSSRRGQRSSRVIIGRSNPMRQRSTAAAGWLPGWSWPGPALFGWPWQAARWCVLLSLWREVRSRSPQGAYDRFRRRLGSAGMQKLRWSKLERQWTIGLRGQRLKSVYIMPLIHSLVVLDSELVSDQCRLCNSHLLKWLRWRAPWRLC